MAKKTVYANATAFDFSKTAPLQANGFVNIAISYAEKSSSKKCLDMIPEGKKLVEMMKATKCSNKMGELFKKVKKWRSEIELLAFNSDVDMPMGPTPFFE